ncbi:MAG TPA: hypothetical protein PL061_13220 [Syntrophales bacterium]|jgi:hypothetical protein|nr:hypothetical protein [Syntrophales bacterium]HPC33910.1 hypothetical protein [Syntrophales bacterium]HRT71444.1 hypothetical protein [Syntrophales bacterium]
MHEWQIIAICATLVAAMNVVVMTYVKHSISKTLSNLETKYCSTNDRVDRVERQIYELRADLPIGYVRREDFIRHEVALNAKLDRIYDRLEKIKGE